MLYTKRILKLTNIIIFCLFFAAISKAKATYYFSTEITHSDGLPKGPINDIAQDHEGYIWIATRNGLFRYDGDNYKIYYPNQGPYNSIPDQVLFNLYIAKDGTLYAGSMFSGVLKYDRQTDTFSAFADTPGNFAIRSVIDVTEDQENRIWSIGKKGLMRLENDGKTYTPFLFKSSEDIGKYLTVAKNQMFFAYYSQNYSGFCQIINEQQSCLREMRIRFILQNPTNDNELWIGTRKKGLQRYQIDEAQWTVEEPEIDMVSAVDMKDGSFLYTTKDDKLGRYDMQQRKIIAIDSARKTPILSPNPYGTIRLLLRDSSGTVWARSHDKIVKIKSSDFIRKVDLMIADDALIKEISEDSEGNLWLITDYHGLVKYDPKRNKSFSYLPPGITKTRARVLLPLPDQSIITGFSGKLFRYFPATDFWQPIQVPKGPIHAINLISDNKIIFDTDKLYTYDLNSNNLVNLFDVYDMDMTTIYDIIPLGAEKFLILDYAKAHLLDLKNNHYQLFKANTPTASGLSRSVKGGGAYTVKNEIWINAVSQRLHRMSHSTSQTPSFESFDLNLNGIILEILSITDDNQGELWLGTNQGLVLFQTKNQQPTLLTQEDGIPKQGFNNLSAFKTKSGKVYFGIKNSLLEVSPEKYHARTFAPNIVVPSVTINDKVVLSGTNYILHPDDNSITFKFASLDFHQSNNNQLKFKLSGFDSSWRQANGNNQAQYTNLPHGDYQFKVRGTNSHGLWSDKEAVIFIQVIPAFWQTPIAYLLYILLIALTIFSAFKWRFKLLEARAEKLKQEVSLRTHQIQNLLEKKNTLFSNISHELRTPLTLIIGPIRKILSDSKSLDQIKSSSTENQTIDENLVKNMNTALDNTNRLIQMVDQLLMLARSSASTQEEWKYYEVGRVIKYIVSSVSSLAEDKNISLQVELDKEIFVKAIEHSLETILLNLTVNAIKYVPRGGQVNISAKVSNNNVAISVKDNGPGIPPMYRDSIFERFTQVDSTRQKQTENNSEFEPGSTSGVGLGLALVKELLVLQNGSIELIDDHGAHFLVKLPVTQKLAAKLAAKKSPSTFQLDKELLSNTNLMPKQTIQSQLTFSIDTAVIGESVSLPPDNQESAFNPLNKDKKILIVDDNQQMCGYLFDLLSNNYSCATAYDGKSGIEIALKEMPDLIISDVMMPGVDGLELTKTLRNNPKASHIPIILLTAQGTTDFRVDAYQVNPDDFITKPFRDDDLLTRIESILTVREILQQSIFRGIGRHAQNLINEAKSQVEENETLTNSTQTKKLAESNNFIDKLNKIIEKHYANDRLTSKDIADHLNMSVRSLQRKVTYYSGVSPLTYLRTFRLEKAAKLIVAGQTSIKLVRHQIGMTNNARFYEYFKQYFGHTPNEYMAKYQKENFNN
ncbi:hybrid sensor histidine kinase/response regulator transcription factor [Aliikangiella coralliicola]|uniref:histidine kinase n=1 Tax=Aliikangiella coralliicola TaxID=2592383 RepID=A0A545UCA3_9GAMM|nr:hybrid sensor histidine kinase/response regulator transcription factor [Aliikangiella coralliicola]TQV87098.1 response regulator [Aliikangiella coralliicola]